MHSAVNITLQRWTNVVGAYLNAEYVPRLRKANSGS